MKVPILDGLRLSLPPEQFEALVEAVAEQVASRLPSRELAEWLDVEAAARYYGYDGEKLRRGKRRIYDLKARGRLRHANDGGRLLFKREWLDAALDGAETKLESNLMEGYDGDTRSKWAGAAQTAPPRHRRCSSDAGSA